MWDIGRFSGTGESRTHSYAFLLAQSKKARYDIGKKKEAAVAKAKKEAEARAKKEAAANQSPPPGPSLRRLGAANAIAMTRS